MDPVTIGIIATLFVLATGGATTAAVRRRNRVRRRQKLTERLRQPRPVAGQSLSLFDVFWDLGASEFALELMAHHDLIPDDGDDLDAFGGWSRLEDLIVQHGNYSEFLDDSLDAIQEFFEQHRQAGHRRKLPGLTGAARRVVPIPRRLESDRDSASAPDVERATPPTSAEVQQRRDIRAGHDSPGLRTESVAQDVDIDRLGDLGAMDILQSVFDGSLGDRIEAWWKMRQLRKLRKELDAALKVLYQFYADTARRNPDFYAPIYDAHQRWRAEATRLRARSRQRPWAGEPFELAGDVLFELAVDLSETLARRAYQTTYHAVETIHRHAQQGDVAMAGYLVYLNRHAFFAGRHPDYADLARKVEFATHRVREEIIRLRDEGIV